MESIGMMCVNEGARRTGCENIKYYEGISWCKTPKHPDDPLISERKSETRERKDPLSAPHLRLN